MSRITKTCSEIECDNKHFARGLCAKHYQRRHGRRRRWKSLIDLPTPDGAKICARCEKEKPLTQFARHGSNVDGFRSKCKACIADDSREWRQKNSDAIRSSWLKRKYGISLADYDRLLAEQDGKCAICSVPEEETTLKCLAVDHNHATGKVRGLLCTRCNTGIGNFLDDKGRLKMAIKYLTGKDK